MKKYMNPIIENYECDNQVTLIDFIDNGEINFTKYDEEKENV